MKKWIIAGGSLATGVVAGAAFVYSGMYDMGTDVPHWPVTMRILETLRVQSITRHSRDVVVPDLNNPQLVLKGAGQYAAMCVNCHLAPGITSSEIRPGLYPMPPELSKAAVDPKVAFWSIKHGIKMSGMPAWGLGHDDAALWSIVAFVNKLPKMSAEHYKDIVARAPPDEEMEGMKGDEDGMKHEDASPHGSPRSEQSEKPATGPMGNMPGMR